MRDWFALSLRFGWLLTYFNPEVAGSIPTEVKRIFLYLVWFPDSLY